MIKKEAGSVHNKLIILYIIVVVILVTLVTWAVLTKMVANTSTNPGTSATVGLTVLKPDTAQFIENKALDSNNANILDSNSYNFQ